MNTTKLNTSNNLSRAGHEKAGFRIISLQHGEKVSFAPYPSAILFVLRGRILLSGKSFSPCPITAGQMFLIPANIDHCINVQKDTELLRLYLIDNKLNFRNHITEKQTEHVPTDHLNWMRVLDIRPRLQQYIALLINYKKDGLSSINMDRIKQQELALLLQAYYKPEELVPFVAPLKFTNNPFYDRTTKIAETFPTINQMAACNNMSRSTFIRQFNLYFKESPSKWLMRQRVNTLIQLLCETNETLPAIAEKLNFSSQQSMSSFCKNHLGGTPVQVRKGEVAIRKKE